MIDLRIVKSKELFSVAKTIFNKNCALRIKVTGSSMFPFLRDTLDSVELTSIDFQIINRYDLVVILRENGQYVLHRVIQKQKNSFFINGDAQQFIEGPLIPNQLIAVVTSIKRGKKWISCSNAWWILLSRIWVFLLPCRPIILKSHSFFLRLFR